MVVGEFGSPLISIIAPKAITRKHTIEANAAHLLSRLLFGPDCCPQASAVLTGWGCHCKNLTFIAEVSIRGSEPDLSPNPAAS